MKTSQLIKKLTDVLATRGDVKVTIFPHDDEVGSLYVYDEDGYDKAQTRSRGKNFVPHEVVLHPKT